MMKVTHIQAFACTLAVMVAAAFGSISSGAETVVAARQDIGREAGGNPAEECREKKWAVVELSSIYMRCAPDYESALETQELMGTVVEVVEQQGYWRKIVSPQPYTAWCTEKGIVEMSQAEIEEYMNAPKVIFTDLYGHVYEKAGKSGGTVCDLVGGDILRVKGRKGRWCEVMLPSGKCGWVPYRSLERHTGFKKIEMGAGCDGVVTGDVMEKVIREASRLKGSPYLWGGMTSKGVDCSGLVRWSFLMNGILLPRNASQQIFCGEKVELDPFTADMKKRTENLRRGDLVFFGTPAEGERKQKVTHVGIYLGDGKIIHSSHLVRINSLIPGTPDYYENSHRLIGAVRL